MRRRRLKAATLCGLCCLSLLFYLFGVTDHVFEKSYELEFDYPLNINLTEQINLFNNGKKATVAPINRLPYVFLTSNEDKCDVKLNLLILVKSAVPNFANRQAIRDSWGKESRDPQIRTLFFLGTTDEFGIQDEVYDESDKYRDIVQMNFNDTYFNNTVKTLMSFRWAYFNCQSKFYFFSDDDMYVSVNNLLKFTRDPFNYPVDKGAGWQGDLFAGFVFKSTPHRHLSSKWRVSLDEYPWDRWPPYVTAGAYVLNEQALNKLYPGSLWIKLFKFDDIYLGILARKLNITPLHCDEFYFYKKMYYPDEYVNVIASHGYHTPKELIKVWSEQSELGFA